MFNWDYKIRREELLRLYEKGKKLQWNAASDIDWSIDVDPAHVLAFLTDGKGEAIPQSIRENPDLPSDSRELVDRQLARVRAAHDRIKALRDGTM